MLSSDADGSATRRKPALSFHPPCVSMVKMWLEPLRHATFLPLWHTTFLPVQPGGVPITVSPLLTSPLLRLGSVGVLTSVPVALVIKRAGYTHTHTYKYSPPLHFDFILYQYPAGRDRR